MRVHANVESHARNVTRSRSRVRLAYAHRGAFRFGARPALLRLPGGYPTAVYLTSSWRCLTVQPIGRGPSASESSNWAAYAFRAAQFAAACSVTTGPRRSSYN
jgi:hypothetical protein